MTDAVALLAELVQIDSVNPGLVPGAAGESGIVAHLQRRLEGAGFTTTVVPAAGLDDRPSLVAVGPGPADRPDVVLNGHLDTVGVGGMDAPFSATVDGDRMVGRGTADMKSGVAAIVVAAEALVEAPVRPVLALVADEEDASLGSEAVIAALPSLGVTPVLCVIGEPTGLAPARSLRGFAVVEVSFPGRAAHSSQPEEGVDAVLHLGRFLAAVDAHAPSVRGRGGDLMVTVVRGGSSPFVIADHASCVVERRTVAGESAADALAEVGALLDPAWSARADLVMHREAWRLDDEGPAAELARALADELGTEPDHDAPAWMEASLWQHVCPTTICGPSGGGLHAVDEWVDLRQVRAYADALVQVLGGGVPTDPRGLRADAPLLDAWLRFHEQAPTSFTIPGHKQRHDLVGDVVAGDVPLYAGLDTMKLSSGVLADAEARAARLWGADVCRFSTGGATHANQALALALAREGDTVVVSRTLHRSLLLGLVLAGLEPVWVQPEVDAATGLPLGVPPAAVDAALAAHPRARAVLVGDPSYVGTVGDVAGLAAVAHAHDVPLVVDAAWAAHFGFHPALPPHALACGADAMVVSAHKTLPAWSQAALVLARTDRIDAARLDAGVEATATTSPAGAVLASTDAARALLERDGEALLGPAIAAVAAARARLREVSGLVVLDGAGVDPLKLTLELSGTGADGVAVERDLLAAGLPVEAAERDVVIGVATLADTEQSLRRLTDVVVSSVQRHRGTPRPVIGSAVYRVAPVTALPPRTAFFADHEAVPVERASGRVSAELVAPYPPGVPVLAPGEQVTDGVLAALHEARAAGVRIAYAADPTLATLRVVR